MEHKIFFLQFQVDDLKAKLAIQEIELKAKNDAADALIEIVGIETEKVSKEKSLGMCILPSTLMSSVGCLTNQS